MRRSYQMHWGRILAVWLGMVGVLYLVTMLTGCDVADAAEWEDLTNPTMTLIAEAGGERPDRIKSMQAVGNVIRNRARVRGQTFDEVVLAKWQFSCHNQGRAKLNAFIKENKEVWDDALTAWQLSGVEDVTGGADHYYADYIKMPTWANGMRETVKIGRHRFFKS